MLNSAIEKFVHFFRKSFFPVTKCERGIMKYLQNTLREIIDFEIEFLTNNFFAAVAFLQSILFM